MTPPSDSTNDRDSASGPVVHQSIGSAGRDATQAARDYQSGSNNKLKVSLMITLMIVFGGMAAAFGINKIQELVNSKQAPPANTTTK